MNFVLVLLVFLFSVGVVEAQTETKVCTPPAPCQLQWNPNTEPDMKEYRVLLSKTSGQYDVTQPAATIPHPTATHSTVNLGTLADGLHFIVVVAVDQSGNVSAFSNEVSFMFDGPPGPVIIELVKVSIP